MKKKPKPTPRDKALKELEHGKRLTREQSIIERAKEGRHLRAWRAFQSKRGG